MNIYYYVYRSKTIDFETFKKYVEDLATSKQMDPEEIYKKLISCGPPGTAGTTVCSLEFKQQLSEDSS